MKIENVLKVGLSSVLAASFMVACGPKSRPGSAIQTKDPKRELEKLQQDQRSNIDGIFKKQSEAEKQKSLELSQSIVGVDLIRTKNKNEESARFQVVLSGVNGATTIEFAEIKLAASKDSKEAKGISGSGETSDKKFKADVSCAVACDQGLTLIVSDATTKGAAGIIVNQITKPSLELLALRDSDQNKTGAKDLNAIRDLLRAVSKTATVRVTDSQVVNPNDVKKNLKSVSNIFVEAKRESDTESSVLSARCELGALNSKMEAIQVTGLFKTVRQMIRSASNGTNAISIEVGEGGQAVGQDIIIKSRQDEKADVIEVQGQGQDLAKLQKAVDVAKQAVAAKEAALTTATEANTAAQGDVTKAKEAEGKADAAGKAAATAAREAAETKAAGTKAAMEKAASDLEKAKSTLREAEEKLGKK